MKPIFYKEDWINTLRKSYGYSYVKELGFPVLSVRSFIFGNRLISLPFSDYGGIWEGRLEVDPVIIEKVLKENSADLLEIRVPSWKTHIISTLLDSSFSVLTRYSTFLIDLSQGIDNLWKKLSKKTRNAIRKAYKFKLKLLFVESLEDLYNYYILYSRVSHEKGSPSHTFSLFKNMYYNMVRKGLARILIAEHSNRAIAGIFLLLGDKWVNLWQCVVPKEYRPLNPSYFLIWESIKEVSQKGFTVFDMGRTRKNSGVYLFKRRWGGKEREILHLIYGGARVIDPLQARYRILSRLWRKLPFSITRLLDPMIIRGIAL